MKTVFFCLCKGDNVIQGISHITLSVTEEDLAIYLERIALACGRSKKAVPE